MLEFGKLFTIAFFCFCDFLWVFDLPYDATIFHLTSVMLCLVTEKK